MQASYLLSLFPQEPGSADQGGAAHDTKPGLKTAEGAAREAKQTAAISLQVSYLLNLFPKGDAAPNSQAVFSLAQPELAARARNPRWKRGLDLTCTLLAMPVWLTLMTLIAGWIKLTSPGPVLYRQTRVGLGGRHFTILKFRSMKVNASTATHTDHFANLIKSNASMVKLDSLGDSRMIPGGSCLRATGLDELPQLFNVLRGEMSLVGPRPALPQEVERYEDWHKGRTIVPPGLTGYWQVNGKNKTSFNQMIELDILYANRMSLTLDLAVMLATIPALILQFVEGRSRRVPKEPRKSHQVPASPQLAPLEQASEALEFSAKAA